MSDLNNKVRFNPVQCTEDLLAKLAPTPGYVYFTTDSKKIYLGTQEKKIPMCSATGFFYGTKEIEYDNSGVTPDPNVKFFFEEIEGDDIPEVDDLILNVDGCFYRVTGVNADGEEIDTTRLTLQGTGGSGGGGGGTSGGSFAIQITGGVSKVYSSEATEMPVTFRGNYNGADENRISQVSFTFKGAEEPFYTHVEEMPFNIEQSIDLIQYKHLFTSNKTTITLKVYDIYGNERSTNFSIQIVDLSLEMTEATLFYSDKNEYSYGCKITGATSGISDKKIVYTFYDQDNATTPRSTQERALNAADTGTYSKSLDLKDLPHGVYVMRVKAQAAITGSTNTLYSNELVHKVARFDSINGSPLLMIMTPEVTEQYTNIPMDYLLVTGETNKTYTLDIKLNGLNKTNLNIVSNTLNTYNLYFEEKGLYNLACNVVELGAKYESILNIVAYTGNLPVIDPTLDELMLYLNPKGKSNDSTDRDKWADYNGKYTADLTDLHYGVSDGWLMDENGTSFLKMTSGAKLEMPTFKPFQYDPTVKNNNASYAGNGMTIELDFEINGVLNYESQIIKCLSLDQSGIIQVGFVITGDRIKFYNSRLNDSLNDKGVSVGSLLSLNLVEGKRIRVSFVIEPNPKSSSKFPMCYAYVNGILSGAVIYDMNDQFKDASWSAATLSVDSEDAQVKIYGIRFYSTALSDKIILNNFTASLPTLEERQARYDTNNVFGASGQVDYLMVFAEDYDLQVPYMKITGGWATEKESKWQLKPQTSANVGLPTGKKDYRMIDVEVKYPKNDYFKDYKDYSFKNEFDSGNTMDKAYGEKPSNGGAIMYAQGTSSMEYPVKNLRLRFKKDKNWFRVRPDISPVEIICMKADYMESSGSHNTGAANFVDDLYKGINIQTPGQEHFGGEGKDTIVTCIKGHPCLIFYSETGEAGSYKYIGKYNLNLDKATPEPFGFNHDDSDFGYLPVGETYYDIEYDDEGEYADTKEGEELKTVTEEKTINSIHCFEFLDNAVEVCNFVGKKQLSPVPGLTEAEYNNNISQNYYIKIEKDDGSATYQLAAGAFDSSITYYLNTPMSYEDTWYGTFVNADNDEVPGWTLGFESRYPEDKVGYHDADALYPFASWINRLYLMRREEELRGLNPNKVITFYDYIIATSYKENTEYFELIDDKYEAAYPNADNFADGTYYTRKVKESRFEMESLERFKREYQCYLNKDFLLTYYLVTEALLMADSRVKNMMIATWGKETGSYVDCTSGATVETNNYIFYPIFYDMDTMLGLDNTGVYRFNYYDEDTDTSIYNGDEILWQFVRDALKSDLAPWYTNLEDALLKAGSILPYFNANQANMANEAFYNGDANYKYLDPARNGYKDHLNDKEIKPGEAPYLYAAQGDRSLMREWFLTNRMNFLRGKYNSSQYQNSDRIVFRWYYPTGTEDDADLRESIKVVPPTGSFDFTSLKTGYAGIKLGANGNVYSARFNGSEPQSIMLPEASAANGTEAYLLGISNLTDVGDLSNKYVQKFVIESNDVRLETLTLGNPHKDYYNPYWSSAKQAIGLSGCTYLENFNLQNCSAYSHTLDFSNCLAIRKILLTGSGTTGITLPPNGLLEELRLPSTVTKLKIVSHPYLTASKFALGPYVYGTTNLIDNNDGGYYTNNYSELKTVWVEDTPIDTYEMVINANKLEEYYLPDIDWEITEDVALYCPRTSEQIDKPWNEYYYYSVEQGYYPYDGDAYPSVGKLFEKVRALDANKNLVAIPALDYLYALQPIADAGVTPADALKGTITINISGAAADELAIYKKYSVMYPNIKFVYGENMNVDAAAFVNFYRKTLIYKINGELAMEEIDIDTLTPYYSVPADGKTLNDIVSATEFTLPMMSETILLTYQFTGQWMDFADASHKIYYQEVGFEDQTVPTDGVISFDFTPTKNMHLIPIFKEYNRVYTANFYNYDSGHLFAINRNYGGAIGPDDLPAEAYYLPKEDDENIGEYQRYGFKGWQNKADFLNNVKNPKLYNLNETYLMTNMDFYPYFEIENVKETASPSAIFVFNPVTVKGTSGYSIAINSGFKHLVSGKITLPDKYNNTNIIAIGDFKNMTNLKEVYFLNKDTCNYLSVLDGQGFNGENENAGESALEHIDLPKSIIYIGEKAFLKCYHLASEIDFNDNVELASQAFYDCYELRLNKLPANMVNLNQFVFTNCRKLNISQLGSNDGSHPLATIGTYALYGACLDTKTLDIGSSVISIGENAFTNGYKNVLMVNDYSNYTAEELVALGLPAGTINDIE